MQNNVYFDEDEYVDSIYKIESMWDSLMASMKSYETVLNSVLEKGINDELISHTLKDYIDESVQYKFELDDLYRTLIGSIIPESINEVKSLDKFEFPIDIMDESKMKLLQIME